MVTPCHRPDLDKQIDLLKTELLKSLKREEVFIVAIDDITKQYADTMGWPYEKFNSSIKQTIKEQFDKLKCATNFKYIASIMRDAGIT